MGLLRALLALSVVFSHSGGLALVGGRNAVQIFYMISGFLISYVVTERRTYGSVSEFYISRYARLWPQYAAIAALTLALSFAVSTPKSELFFQAFNSLSQSYQFLLALSNALLFGQDWLMFVRITNGGFNFASNFREAARPAYYGLLLPQAWTLGVELSFYVIAPFVLPRRWLMTLLLAASILIRFLLIKTGIGLIDPWTYRFFPTELALFLFGAFFQQLSLPIYRRNVSQRWDIFIVYSIIGMVLFYQIVPATENIKSAILIACCALALPALFRFQHGRKWDVATGNLSYPIYINHVLVIAVVHHLGFEAGSSSLAIGAAILSGVAAVGMNYFIGRPVERWRNALKKRVSADFVTEKESTKVSHRQ